MQLKTERFPRKILLSQWHRLLGKIIPSFERFLSFLFVLYRRSGLLHGKNWHGSNYSNIYSWLYDWQWNIWDETLPTAWTGKGAGFQQTNLIFVKIGTSLFPIDTLPLKRMWDPATCTCMTNYLASYSGSSLCRAITVKYVFICLMWFHFLTKG